MRAAAAVALVGLLIVPGWGGASEAIGSPPMPEARPQPPRRRPPRGRPTSPRQPPQGTPTAPAVPLRAYTKLADNGARRPLSSIRVAVVQVGGYAPAAAQLRVHGFTVQVVEPLRLEKLKDADVVYFASGWFQDQKEGKLLDEMASVMAAFLRRGGGLVVAQPNPHGHPGEQGTPLLLPYPIVFHNLYLDEDVARKNLDPSHFITDDVPPAGLPYPSDRMLEVDERYRILARAEGSKTPSLVVSELERGRVVVTSAHDQLLPAELVRRMVVWAAHAEPARFER